MAKEILGSMEFRVDSRKAETKSFLMMTKLSSTSSVFTNFEIFDMFNPGYSSIFTQKKKLLFPEFMVRVIKEKYGCETLKPSMDDFTTVHGMAQNCNYNLV